MIPQLGVLLLGRGALGQTRLDLRVDRLECLFEEVLLENSQRETREVQARESLGQGRPPSFLGLPGWMAGSWTPDGPHAHVGGRVYMTSLAICTLEVYYRHAPIFRRLEM